MNESLLKMLLRDITLDLKIQIKELITTEYLCNIDFSGLPNSQYSDEQRKIILKNIMVYLLEDNIVSSLNLSNNLLGDALLINMVCNLIKNNDTLTHIDLSHNKLLDIHIKLLCEALICNRRLKKLNLTFNRISLDGAKHILMALQKNVDLLHNIKIVITCNDAEILPLLVGLLFFPEKRIAHLQRSSFIGMFVPHASIEKRPSVSQSMRSSSGSENDVRRSAEKKNNFNNSASIEIEIDRLLSGDLSHRINSVDRESNQSDFGEDNDMISLLRGEGTSKKVSNGTKANFMSRSQLCNRNFKASPKYTQMNDSSSNLDVNSIQSDNIISRKDLLVSLEQWQSNSNKMNNLKLPRKYALKLQAQKYGFNCIDVPGDGACFFHAVSDQIRRRGRYYSAQFIREQVVDYLLKNINNYQGFLTDVNTFIKNLVQKDGEADNVAIQVTSKILNLNITIIRSDAAQPIIIESLRPNPLEIFIGYEVGVHYQSLIQSSSDLKNVLQVTRTIKSN